MKTYNIRYNVGRAKYLVNYHDGVKQHKDGSAFFDVAIFMNKQALGSFLLELTNKGYREVQP